jgi:hypothetical protein
MVKYYLSTVLSCLVLLNTASAQVANPAPPNIKYSGPKTFTTGTAITPIIVANTGGAVPANTYGLVSAFAGMAGITGNVNGTGAQASFSFPEELGVDPSGNIFVNDNGNDVIRKITPSGVVSTFAGSGAFGGTNGPGPTATFINVNGLTVDVNGNVYVSEDSNDDIRKITPDGTVSTFAGQLTVSGSANGLGTQATFFGPLGLGTDAAGNIYVADYSNYLIRKITPAGLVSTVAGLVGVAGSTNGPVSVATFRPLRCAADRLGNIFIIDYEDNIIRKISPDGQVSTFAGSGAKGTQDGIGTAAIFNQPDAMTIDAIGNLYVGDDGNSIIRKITPAGVVTTLAGANGLSGSNDGIGTFARFTGVGGLAIDINGTLYVTDNNTIRKVSTTGYAIDKPLPAGLVFDPTTGSITGIPSVTSPATDYTITAYNTGGSSTTTINIQVTGNLSFGPIQPMVYGAGDFDSAVSTSGTVTYTSDNLNVASIIANKIHIESVGTSKITASNGSTSITQPLTVTPAPLTIIADNKSRSAGANNPPLTMTFSGFAYGDNVLNLTSQPVASTSANTSSLPGSYPIIASGAIDSNYAISYIPGTITVLGGSFTAPAPIISYAATTVLPFGKTINPLSPSNSGGAIPASSYGQVNTIAGKGGVGGAINGSASQATFNQPYGITIDKAGNIYIAEQVNNLIRKITPAGIVSTFAGNGSSNSVNGTGTAASFYFPSGLTIDTAGNLYVAEQGFGLIRKITPQGVVSTFAGGGASLNGQGTQASFSGPIAVAIDKSGNLYVADTYNALIRKITPTGLVSTLAGIQRVQGTTDGPATSATFMQPSGITVDAIGNVYVSDLYRLRKILPDGTVSTIAGNGTIGSKDGMGSQATFSYLQGLATDRIGNIYVSDEGAELIRKVTQLGVVTTIVGTPYAYGTTDSIGKDARISSPSGMTIDTLGTLYFNDQGNNLIRKISLTGYSIDKTLPAGLAFDPKTGIISGAPTASSAPTNYTITAYNLSGSSTAIISLAVGLPSDVNLKNLTVTAGTLSPVFTQQTTAYSVNVPNATTSISIAAAANDTSASVKVNGTTSVAGLVTTAIALTVGTNTIPILITAEDGTTKTYTITATRASSSNASLNNLTIGNATLSPSFVSGTENYTASLSNTVSSISVNAIAGDASAAIKVNGVTTSSGNPSQNIPLAVGSNTITVAVTAQDGITQSTYTVNVTREIPKIYMLSSDNFKLTITSASCKGTADGSIVLTAAQNLNYVATLSGSGPNISYPFSTSLTINNLSAGNYSICISVADQPDYQQCYDVVIDEPKDLSLYSSVNPDNTITLALSGGNRYNIQLNGNMYATADSSITLPLVQGNNDLIVTTDKLCQGTIRKLINNSGNLIPYPNPFQDILNLNLGNATVTNVQVEISDVVDGKLVYSNKYINQAGVLQLDLNGLKSGVYVLHLSMDNKEKIFKLIKK